MSNVDFDDDQEVERAPRAVITGKKAAVKKKAAGNKRRTVPAPQAVAEAPVRRNNPRPAPRMESTRDLARETTRSGAVVVVGRDGEQLTRRRTSVGDKYDVPRAEIPRGWSYQWNPVSVLGQKFSELVEQGDLQMFENGWRPVPASRHPGRWTPHGYEGSIVIDGLRLEERPESLTQEAKQEDEMRAKALVRDRTDALRLTQKQLPGAREAAHRGNAGQMRMSIDPGLDIPVPQHELDEGQE